MKGREEKTAYAFADGRVYPVTLSFCPVKSLSMRVAAGVIVVKAPTYTKYETIKEFLKKHERWLRTRLDQARTPTDELLIKGASYKVGVSQGKKQVVFSPIGVFVQTPDGSRESSMRLLKAEYKKRAEDHLVQRVYELFPIAAPVVGRLKFPKVTVRYCTSYWGKCFFDRNEIRLNAYLYQAEQEVVDYVILHEYAHFLHHAHSPAFYRTVEEMMPNYKEGRKKQKKYACKTLFDE